MLERLARNKLVPYSNQPKPFTIKETPKGTSKLIYALII